MLSKRPPDPRSWKMCHTAVYKLFWASRKSLEIGLLVFWHSYGKCSFLVICKWAMASIAKSSKSPGTPGYIWLVGGWALPEKNDNSSVMMTFPTEWKNKTCSKPPTSNYGISTSASWDISFTLMMNYNPQKLVDLHPQVNKTGQNTAKSHG